MHIFLHCSPCHQMTVCLRFSRFLVRKASIISMLTKVLLIWYKQGGGGCTLKQNGSFIHQIWPKTIWCSQINDSENDCFDKTLQIVVSYLSWHLIQGPSPTINHVLIDHKTGIKLNCFVLREYFNSRWLTETRDSSFCGEFICISEIQITRLYFNWFLHQQWF